MSLTNNSINNAIVSNTFSLPNTGIGPIGIINFGGIPWISNLGGNVNVGPNAGYPTVIPGVGANNTQIGDSAGFGNLGGFNNVFLGSMAGYFDDGNNSIAIGANSNGGNAGYNVIIGTNSGKAAGGIANQDTVVVGCNAFIGSAGGIGNIVIGYSALTSLTGGDYNISIGYNSGSAYLNNESSNILIGSAGVLAEMNVMRLGTDGTGTGQQSTTYIAGLVTTARGITSTTGNITATSGNFVSTAATSSTVGQFLIGGNIVFQAFGTRNIFAGAGAGNFTLTAVNSVGIGSTALASLTSGNGNSAIGNKSLTTVSSGASNTAMGNLSGNFISTGAQNVAIGASALGLESTGSTSTAIGYFALQKQALSVGNNTALGMNCLSQITTGHDNIGIGSNAGSNYTSSESSNIIILNSGVTAESNVMRLGTDGTGTGQQNATFIAGLVTTARGITSTVGDITITSGNLNITAATSSTVGQITQAGNRIFHTFGTNNLFLGQTSGNFTLSGANNLGIGLNTLSAVTTGNANVVLGRNSFQTNTTGLANVIIGDAVAPLNTSNNNVIIGADASAISTSGNQNVIIGAAAAAAILTGASNVLIGKSAGSAYIGAESSNILIGAAITGTAGESHVCRIGTSGSGTGQQNQCFIAGIFGITVGVSGVPVVVDTTGQLGTIVSSIRYKENVEDMSDLSSSIMSFRPVVFNYKSDKEKNRKYGLIAEEVKEIMPELVVYNENNEIETVKYLDLPILLLNELQKMSKELQDALNRIKTLETKLFGD